MKAVGFVWLCALCSVIESDAQVQMETLCSEEQQAELLAYWDSEVKKTKQKKPSSHPDPTSMTNHCKAYCVLSKQQKHGGTFFKFKISLYLKFNCVRRTGIGMRAQIQTIAAFTGTESIS